MLHYFAKKFFAPVIVTSRLKADGQLDVIVVSDLTQLILNAEVAILVFSWNSFDPLYVKHIQTDVVSRYEYFMIERKTQIVSGTWYR